MSDVKELLNDMNHIVNSFINSKPSEKQYMPINKVYFNFFVKYYENNKIPYKLENGVLNEKYVINKKLEDLINDGQ